MQTQLLEKYPDAPLRVYAVWFNMYPGDERAKWPASLLSDGRVIHLWDEGKVVGRWYGDRADSMRSSLTPESKWTGQILWDSYLVYAPDATWEDAPTRLLRWGRTIVAAREPLRRDFQTMFTSPR